jgi:hypothetical protein
MTSTTCLGWGMKRIFLAAAVAVAATCFLFAETASAFRQYNPLHQVTTDLFGSSWLNPTLGLDLGKTAAAKYPLTWAGGVRVDIPIYDYFKAGFETEILVTEPNPADRNSSRSPVFILAANFKPQYPITLGKGNYLAPYLLLSPGLVANFLGIDAGINLYNTATNPGTQGYSLNPIFGFGASLTGLGGVEYFPIAELVIFVDAGYKALLFAYPLLANERNPPPSFKYHTFWMWAPVVNFGLKINI